MMLPLSLRLLFLLAGALAVAAWVTMPRGIEAGRLLAVQDDPAALADLALDKSFDARVAEREIAAALDAGDAELAESFLALARERNLAVDGALVGRIADAASTSAAAARGVSGFVRGFVVGEPDDLASLAGTTTGDLFVFGDARDAVREGVRLARGQEADELILGLACVGLAVTAGTYATVGMGTPARVGLSLVKAARKTGRMGEKLSGAVVQAVRTSVDSAALRQAFSRDALVRPAVALRAVREAVKVEEAGGLLNLVRDVGRVQSKAGTRATLDGLKLAETPKDVTRLKRLAEAKGIKTRAVIKLLGRGAIMLTTGVFNLTLWVLWALVNLVGIVAAIKRAAERWTLAFIHRRKRLRARAHPVRIEPISDRVEAGCALDSMRLSHFLRRTGVHPGSSPGQAFGGKCSAMPQPQLAPAEPAV